MATKLVRMLATASGPKGTYLQDKVYEVDEADAKAWTTPNANTGSVYAEIVLQRDLAENAIVNGEPQTDTEDKANGTKPKAKIKG